MKKMVLVLCSICSFFNPVLSQDLSIQDGYRRIVRQINGLELCIDGRMELLTVMQLLSNHWTISTDENSYHKAMEEYFMPFSEHEFIGLTKKVVSRKGYSAEKPYALMLALDHSFEPYEHTKRYIADLIHPDQETVTLFLHSMKQFVEESRFWSFFQKNISFYDAILDEQIKTLTRFDGVSELQNFYGEKHDSYTIINKPLDYASYGLSIPDAERKDKVCFVYGFTAADSRKIDSEVNFTNLFWHEFGHTFVNDITASYSQKVGSTKFLYAPISKVDYSYPNWETAINEQIIRGVTTYLAFDKFGREEGIRILRKEHRAGFLYTEGLLPLLHYYQQNRGKYSTFREYFPSFMNQFSTLKPDNTELIKGRRLLSLDSAYVILPDFDHSLASIWMIENIKKCLEKEFSETGFTFISDKTALEKDLSAFPIIAFGCINAKNNQWINQYIHALPFQFKKNSIIVDGKKVKGDHLRMFTAFRNPQNKKLDALLFLSLNAVDMIDIATLKLVFQSFGIFDNETFKCSGNYKPGNNGWEIDDIYF